MHTQLTDITILCKYSMCYSYPVRGSGAGKTRLDQVRGLKGVCVYMCVCFKVANLRESRVIAALFRACVQESRNTKGQTR